MIRAYRVAVSDHPLFDGGGAALVGGRWNSPRRRVIYAGESFAIAMLERLVYAGINRLPDKDCSIEIVIPDDVSIEHVDPAALPGWDDPGYEASRAYGDRWYDERRSAVLIVSSAVIRCDRSLAINQMHPEFPRLRASDSRPVRRDVRLFSRKTDRP